MTMMVRLKHLVPLSSGAMHCDGVMCNAMLVQQLVKPGREILAPLFSDQGTTVHGVDGEEDGLAVNYGTRSLRPQM